MRKIKNWASKLNLRNQLIICFVLITCLAVLIGSKLTYDRVLKLVQKETEQFTLQIFHQVEQNLQVKRVEIDNLSKSVLLQPDFQRLLELSPSLDEYERGQVVIALRNYLTNVMNNNPTLHSIDLFTDDKWGLEVERNSTIYVKDDRYVASAPVQLLKGTTNESIWVGGLRLGDYNATSIKSKEQNSFMISLLRRAGTFVGDGIQGTLVFHIKASEFTGIYRDLSASGDMYVIDEHGRIISEKGEDRLAQLSDQFKSISSSGKSYGSYTSGSDNEKKQIVFYKLSGLRWTLVKETPFNEFFANARSLRNILFVVFFITVTVAIFAAIILVKQVTKPILTLMNSMNQLEKGYLGTTIQMSPNNEFAKLNQQFNRMSTSMSKLVSQMQKVESEKRDLEIQTLQSQINPHFLYNTLNAIKCMAIISADNHVADSITSLGAILQPIYRNPSITCAVHEELDFSVNYMKIMSMRMGEVIPLGLDVPESFMDQEILRFVFQPLIENVFVHGFNDYNAPRMIRIGATRSEQYMEFSVVDSGKGIPQNKLMRIRERLNNTETEPLPSEGIALLNVHKRIRLHFGEGNGVQIESHEGIGTTVTIKVPLMDKN